jgi:predicted AlkP superfamily phosphohydrolase/phosphomutase
MEDKRCPVFVDGKECGLPLTRVDLEAEKIARYDLATYQCSLGHRSYILLEPRSKARASDMAREVIERKMDELTRKYVETRDPEIREEIYKLAKRLEEMDKGVKS